MGGGWYSALPEGDLFFFLWLQGGITKFFFHQEYLDCSRPLSYHTHWTQPYSPLKQRIEPLTTSTRQESGPCFKWQPWWMHGNHAFYVGMGLTSSLSMSPPFKLTLTQSVRAMRQGYTWTVQQLPESSLHAFSFTFLSCVTTVLEVVISNDKVFSPNYYFWLRFCSHVTCES